LKVDGATSEGIVLTGNDFSGAARAVERTPDVPMKAIAEIANLVD